MAIASFEETGNFYCPLCQGKLDVVDVGRHTGHKKGDPACIVVDLECPICPIISMTIHLAYIPQFRHLLDQT